MDNGLIHTPISITDLLRIGVVVLFGVIIFMSFMYGTFTGWLIKRRDPKNDFYKEPTKVIGGLGVLVMAIVANNAYIYGVSLFIGGLLIASEKFMINLAAIFNSDRKNVQNIAAHWEDANDQQVEQKQEAEAEDVTIDQLQRETAPKANEPRAVKAQEAQLERTSTFNLAKIREVEHLTLNHLEQLVSGPGRALRRYIADGSQSAHSRRIYDGAVIDTQSSAISFAIEILYRQDLVPGVLRISLKRTIEHMQSDDFPLLIVVVASNYDAWTKGGLTNFKKSLKRQYPNVSFGFYQTIDQTVAAFDESDVLELIK